MPLHYIQNPFKVELSFNFFMQIPRNITVKETKNNNAVAIQKHLKLQLVLTTFNPSPEVFLDPKMSRKVFETHPNDSASKVSPTFVYAGRPLI